MSAPPGNKFAAKQNRVITDTLRRVVAQNPEKVRIACEKALDKAADGDLQTFREIADRLDGKPTQSVEMNVTRTQSDMDDSELARIIRENRCSGTTRKKDGKEESGIVH